MGCLFHASISMRQIKNEAFSSLVSKLSKKKNRKKFTKKKMKHESKTEIMKNTDKTKNVISRRMIACTR